MRAKKIFLIVVAVAASIEASPVANDVPIVLVHGFKDTAAKLEKMARCLRADGRTVHTITVTPSFGQVGIDELAGQLAAFIDTKIDAHSRIDLVGFSMGGLICRYYVQRLDGLVRVNHLVTISSPHHGTWMAYLLGNRGALQMRPGSDFLRDLNDDLGMLERLQFTSIWTPLDLMIVPSNSSRVPIGREIKLWIPLHPLMVWNPQAIRAVSEELSR